MSYCRWSSDNGYCDVYVYEDVSGGWTTHVAGMRRPEGRPEDFLTVYFRLMEEGVDGQRAWSTAKEAEDKTRLWDEANKPFPIDHPEAGESFNHETPVECAENLERLRAEGFRVPQYAIDDLREEHEELQS